MKDGDLVMKMMVKEFHDLQKVGFWQVMGYAALRIMEIISKHKTVNGELSEAVQTQIAVGRKLEKTRPHAHTRINTS